LILQQQAFDSLNVFIQMKGYLYYAALDHLHNGVNTSAGARQKKACFGNDGFAG
jgi:hypothetical protein